MHHGKYVKFSFVGEWQKGIIVFLWQFNLVSNIFESAVNVNFFNKLVMKLIDFKKQPLILSH